MLLTLYKRQMTDTKNVSKTITSLGARYVNIGLVKNISKKNDNRNNLIFI